ncbi:hypothetical protein F5144DRAFT_386050 [Chaetomium tenue]|uniref:Uncharacterized protein n=1 Tax=Chaetomium tenue TaxID=1854479 RepID=A0ACB7NWT9_9PEZI|nr:hypothetical protein F5144DRAFT_386050 [Chaetomium globosum]
MGPASPTTWSSLHCYASAGARLVLRALPPPVCSPRYTRRPYGNSVELPPDRRTRHLGIKYFGLASWRVPLPHQTRCLRQAPWDGSRNEGIEHSWNFCGEGREGGRPNIELFLPERVHTTSCPSCHGGLAYHTCSPETSGDIEFQWIQSHKRSWVVRTRPWATRGIMAVQVARANRSVSFPYSDHPSLSSYSLVLTQRQARASSSRSHITSRDPVGRKCARVMWGSTTSLLPSWARPRTIGLNGERLA